MPFLRLTGHPARTREVFPQGHRIYQSAVPYVRLTCREREHIPPLPCHSKQWASARPSLNTSVAVKLKFDKRVAFRVYDEFANEVTEDEQGNLYVQTNLPSNDALYSYLFSFADYVELLELEIIRGRVKEKLAAMQKKYVT